MNETSDSPTANLPSDSPTANPSTDPTTNLAALRCVFFDVDGVLTDGRMYFADGGVQMRAFDAHDGLGISRLLRAGVAVAWISSGRSDCVSARGRVLGVRRVFQGVKNKLEVVQRILEEDELTPETAAYVGDDLPDLPAMRHVGLAIAVPQATAEVREAAHYITEAPGGNGAVREVCEKILAAKMAEGELILNPEDGTPNSIKEDKPHYKNRGDRPFSPRDGGGGGGGGGRPPFRGNRPPPRDGNRPPPGNRRFGRDEGGGGGNRFSRDDGGGNRFSRDGGGGGGNRFSRGDADGNRRFPEKDGNRPPPRRFDKKERHSRPQDDWRE